MAANNLDIRITATENASGAFQKVGSAAETAGQAIERAGKAGSQGLDSLSSRIKAFSSEIQTVGVALAGFGAGMTAAFGLAASKSIALESAMANFSSISGLTGSQLGGVTDQVRALAVEMGKSPTELAAGLYDIQSSGFAAADAMSILRTATIAGVAGITSTATAGKAITAVLNAYSLTADKAGDVSDVLFETVNRGVLTFDQLANNLGATIPVAAQLGVSIEELGAAYAELTLQGISAAQSETAIAALMRSAVNETAAMTEAVQEYGFASAEALIQSEGLAGFLTFLTEASGGSSSALLELVGSAEGMTAAMALMRNGGDDFIATLDAVNAAAQDGATTQDVFAVQAETTAFALQQLGAAFTDIQVTMGNALAPIIGQVADSMRAMALMFSALPDPIQQSVALLGAFGGASTLAVGSLLLLVPKIAETVSAFKALKASSFGASLASMAAAAGPLAIALGGIAVIGGILVASWLEQKQAVAEYNTSLQELNDTIFQLEQAGSTALANRATAVIAATEALQAAFETTKPSKSDEVFQGLGVDEQFEAYNEAQQVFVNNLGDLQADVTEITNNINEALSHPEIDATQYLDWIERLTTQVAATESGLDDLAVAEMIANTTLEDYVTTTQSAVDVSGKLSRSLSDVAAAAESAGVAIDSAVKDEVGERMQRLNDATTDWLSNGDNILGFWLELTSGMGQASATAGSTAEDFAAINAELEAAADFRALVQLAEDADNAAEALDAVLRTFQQIDELGSRSAAAGTIADNLIGEPGEWAVIDELLEAGRISLMEYQGAISAGTAIQESNLRVQEDLNAMRVAQLPLLASEQLAYEAMIDQISQLEPLEQRRALALMDSNVQAQIASQYATAYSASLGEIPTEVATSMIVSAAEADPVLKDLLLQFGLIEEGADGTITVNFPDGPTVQESIAELTASIDALTRAIGGVPPLRIDADTQDALAKALGVKQAVEDLDGTEATTTINAEDEPAITAIGRVLGDLLDLDGQSATTYQFGNNSDALGAIGGTKNALDGLDGDTATVTMRGVNGAALGSISEVGRALGGLDGRTATVTINAIDNARAAIGGVAGALSALNGRSATVTTNYVSRYTTVGSPSGAPRQLGGVVDRYALGGTIPIWAAEGNRPEIAHFASGGSALLPREGMYYVDPGTYISPSNAVGNQYSYGGDTHVTVIVQGSVTTERELTGNLTREIGTAIRDDLIRHRTAAGVN